MKKTVVVGASENTERYSNQAILMLRERNMPVVAIGIKEGKVFEAPEKALPEELFPPCIKLILNGLDDGRKRALFILINYFTSIGWDYDMIEKRLREWNAKNREPLRDVYLIGQLRYHKQMQKKILPPNCDNEMYMVGIGVHRLCDELHKKGIKNPAQYTLRKARLMNREKVKIKNERIQ